MDKAPIVVTNQKLLDECQSEIAKKYGLGDKLVTGHRKGFFDEATELYFHRMIKHCGLI
jgi:hypothetical protein